MELLIWPGAIIALLGVFGLAYCILSALKIRAAKLDDEQTRAKLQGLVALNMAALGISAIGLMMVVTGVLLG